MRRQYYVVLLCLLCCPGSPIEIGRLAPAAEVRVMPKLHIALHDGFGGNHVVVTVDGNVVFDRNGVKTDLRISRADAVDIDVARTSVAVAVSVEPGAIAGAVTVDVASTPFLAIDLQDGRTLQFKPSAEPFRYL